MSVNVSKKNPQDLAPLIHQAALDPFISLDTLHEICDASQYLGFSGLCTKLPRLSVARERLGQRNQTK